MSSLIVTTEPMKQGNRWYVCIGGEDKWSIRKYTFRVYRFTEGVEWLASAESISEIG